MSLLDYVVVYYKNGNSSTHSLGCWEELVRCYKENYGETGIISIQSTHGGTTITRIDHIEAIHLVTEDEVLNDAARKAAIRKADREADTDWSDR